jgi:hypothetical protein
VICSFCGVENSQAALMVRDYFDTEDEFSLCECDSCGVAFTNYVFDEASYHSTLAIFAPERRAERCPNRW